MRCHPYCAGSRLPPVVAIILALLVIPVTGAESQSATTVSPAGAGASAWEVKLVDTGSPPTRTLLASLYASLADGGDLGEVRLVARCRQERLDVLVYLGGRVVADSQGIARLRIQWNDARSDSTFWPTSTSREAVFAPAATDFVEQGLLRHARLRLQVPREPEPPQVTPVNVVYEFAPAGLEPHLPQLKRECAREPWIGTDVSRPSGAPGPAYVKVGGERVYFEFEVDKPVGALPNVRGPEYPMDLRKQNIAGEVLVQFVVDSTGRPILGTLKVLRSTDPGFTKSVRDFLRRAVFSPAELRGVKVRQLVQQPFNFTLWP